MSYRFDYHLKDVLSQMQNLTRTLGPITDSVHVLYKRGLALQEAVEFLDRVRSASPEERAAVGDDHWTQFESAAREMAEMFPKKAPIPVLDGGRPVINLPPGASLECPRPTGETFNGIAEMTDGMRRWIPDPVVGEIDTTTIDSPEAAQRRRKS